MSTQDLENKSFLAYLIGFYSLFITVLLYVFLLKILGSSDQVSYVDELLPYYRPYIVTHTLYIIPYYIAIAFIPAASIYLFFFFSKLVQRYRQKVAAFIPFLKVISFVLLILAFLFIIINGLSSLSIYKDIFEINPIIYTRVFMGLFFSGLLFLSLLYLYPSYSGLSPKRTSLARSHLARLINLLIIILIIFTLNDRTMDEKYLFVSHPRQYVHSAVFVSPIYDVVNGKAILVDTDSQYGIFINYLPALIFKFITPLTFTSFFYLLVVYGIIYYIAAYLLLKLRFQSIFWAFLGLLSLFTFHFYSSLDRYALPMIFPIRYMLDLPFFLLLLIFPQKQSKISEIILPLFLALSLFYNLEIGLPLVVAYFVFLLLYTETNLSFFSISSLRKNHLFKQLILIITSIFFIGLLYSLYAKFTTGFFPDWSRSFFYLRILSRATTVGKLNYFFLIPLGIYLAVLIRTAILQYLKKADFYHIWEASFAVYGLLILTNFISRGYILNLVSVSIPAIILGVSLFRDIYLFVRNIGDQSSFILKLPLFAPFIILGSFLIASLLYYPYRLTTNYRYEYWKGNKEYSVSLYRQIEKVAAAIKHYQPSTKKVVILSFLDTLLAMKADRINILPFSSSQNVITNGQEEKVLKTITRLKPQYIYADTAGSWSSNIYPHVYQYLQRNYQIIDHVEIIDVWKLNKSQIE